MTTTNTENLFTSSNLGLQNYGLFLAHLGTAVKTEEELGMALVSDARLALISLAEICFRNPTRTEGAEYSFSRRDRGHGFRLATMFLTNEPLTAQDVLDAVNLAFRYRRQIANLIPSATPETATSEIVDF